MKEQILAIQTKVDQLVSRLDKLNHTNKTLTADNITLKSELSRLKRQLKDSQLGSGDTSEVVKRKLTSIYERLNELENLAG